MDTVREIELMARRAQQLADELRDLAATAADQQAQRPPAPTVAPTAAPAPVDERYWFTTRQAGERAGVHPTTVLRACEAGLLHGSQRVPRGAWRIHIDCLDAWIEGTKCPHGIA